MLALPVVLAPVVFAISLMATPNWGLASAVPWVAAMVFFGVGGLFCAGWALVASAFLLPVIQDTAEGNDEIENWPEPPFLDWNADFFYIFNSLSVSVLCGVVVVQVLGFAGPLKWLAIPLSVFLLFPIALLSTLEADSPLKPLSLPVLGSLFSVGWAWALFYVEAAALTVAFLFLAGVVLGFVGPWGLLPVGALWLPVLMVYFRLLGRLAWCGARGSQEEGKEKERPQQEEEPPRPPAAAAPPEAPAAPAERPHKRAPSILDDDWDVS